MSKKEYELLKDQIVACTKEDAHGEKYDRQYLLALLSSMPDRIPLHQQHDLSLPIEGWIENLHIEEMPDQPGEFAIYGDINIEKEKINEFRRLGLGGWSHSATVVTHVKDENEDVMAQIFLPFPYYNDNDLIDKLLKESKDNIKVGKWIKKAIDPESIALIIIGIVLDRLLSKQAWDLAKSTLRNIKDVLNKHMGNLHTNWVFLVSADNANIEVLITIQQKAIKPSEDDMKKVVDLTNHLISNEGEDPQSIRRIVGLLDNKHIIYLERIEYNNGEIKYLVGYKKD